MAASNTPSRTALIVGASRGLGLALASEYLRLGWSVIATERASSASQALAQLAAAHAPALGIERLDINDAGQIAALASKLEGRSLDLLYVNAGVIDDPSRTASQVDAEEFARVLVTNALSPIRVIDGLAPLVAPGGTIAAMTSALGSVAGNTEGGFEVYRASKAALNSLLRSYVARAQPKRTVLAIMPGWVRTDMGGPEAPLDAATSARGIAQTIAKHEGRGGIAFVDHEDNAIAW